MVAAQQETAGDLLLTWKSPAVFQMDSEGAAWDAPVRPVHP